MKMHWGAGIALTYTAFAAATLGFAVFAMEQPVELVSPDYYQRALDHDQRMAAEANAARIGDAFRFEVDAPARAIALTWTAAPPDDAGGSVTFYRASGSAMDRVRPIAANPSDGRQVLALDGLAAGQWHVQVRWRHAGLDYYVERAIVIP